MLLDLIKENSHTIIEKLKFSFFAYYLLGISKIIITKQNLENSYKRVIFSFHPHLERMLPNKYHVTQLASTFSLCGVAPYVETLAMDTFMFIIQKRVEY